MYLLPARLEQGHKARGTAGILEWKDNEVWEMMEQNTTKNWKTENTMELVHKPWTACLLLQAAKHIETHIELDAGLEKFRNIAQG